MRNYEGDIIVDSISFWAFVDKHNTLDVSAGGFDNPKWDHSEQLLEIPHQEGETLYIDGSDFWSWIIKDFCPSNSDEYAFDIPKWDSSMKSMFVKFAASNECHPNDWFLKPEWMRKK